MEFQSSDGLRRVDPQSLLPMVKIHPQTCISALAIGPEAGNRNSIEVVGGESGVDEQDESGKGSEKHRACIEEFVWGYVRSVGIRRQ